MAETISPVSFLLLKLMDKNFSRWKFLNLLYNTAHYNCLFVMCIRIWVTKWCTTNKWVHCNLQSKLLWGKLHLFSYMSDVEYWWDNWIGQTCYCSHCISIRHLGRQCCDSRFRHQIQKHVSVCEAVVYVLNIWWLSQFCHSNHELLVLLENTGYCIQK